MAPSDDKPWDFGSFEKEQSMEQQRAGVRPIARWLYAQYMEYLDVGFPNEYALLLTNESLKQVLVVMLSPLTKKASSSGDGAS